jgi:nicotinamidase/pyrazinamidase
MAEGDALLMVDVQRDFTPGGALPAPYGDRVVPVLNEYARRFAARHLPLFASRDWHPPETAHFKAFGGPWPPHCVQDTEGAEFHPDLALPVGTQVVSKGLDPGDHGYSAFEATLEDGRLLNRALEDLAVRRLFVGGIATDYCVRASVLDAAKHGYQPVLLLDAVQGIDVEPGDVARAMDEMLRAGARTATLVSVDGELDG